VKAVVGVGIDDLFIDLVVGAMAASMASRPGDALIALA
jgi:hypothetical protein